MIEHSAHAHSLFNVRETGALVKNLTNTVHVQMYVCMYICTCTYMYVNVHVTDQHVNSFASCTMLLQHCLVRDICLCMRVRNMQLLSNSCDCVVFSRSFRLLQLEQLQEQVAAIQRDINQNVSKAASLHHQSGTGHRTGPVCAHVMGNLSRA